MAQTINVDVTPSLFQPTLYYHQGDIGREFAINISTKDGYEIPSGATVKIEATKPSGFGFSVEGTLSGNTVTFVSTEGMTDEWGRFPAQLEITSGNTVIYTANFLMVGEKDTHPASTVDGSQEDVIPQLTLLVERVENAAAAVLDTTTEVTTLPAGSQATYSFDEETNTATFGIPQGEAGAGSAGVVASAYSASKTYAVGDYAIHNGNLYRCTTAIATAESFNASHWTQVVLADDVTNLKNETNYGYFQLTSENFVNGVYSGGSITSTGVRIASKRTYPVKKGDAVEIKTNTLQVAHGLYLNGATASTDYHAWYSAPSGEEYIVPMDGQLFIQLRKSDDAALSPADYDATIKIYSTRVARLAGEVNLNRAIINELNENSGLFDFGYDSSAIQYTYDNSAKLDIVKNGLYVRVNGFNTSGAGCRIKINGDSIAVAISGGQVEDWSNGLKFKAGHEYVIENYLTSGNVVLTNTNHPTMSIYKVGVSSSSGSLILTEKGSKRYFTAEKDAEYNVVLYVNSGTSLNNAEYCITIKDLTDDFAEKTHSKRVYTHSAYAIQQGGVFVDNTIYMFHSNSPTGITKVDIETGIETEYQFDFDHGNDMTYYNGKLYICSMDGNGRIYIVDAATMTLDSYVDFKIDGVSVTNYGIAYDAVNRQFVLELIDGFAFTDMNLAYKSRVTKSFTDTGTIQGIECDGQYIYLVESTPNEIAVFDYNGAYVDCISVDNSDEPESLYYDKDGGWWLFTNVIGAGWYLDAVQITKNINLDNVVSLIKTFSKI